MKKLIFPIIFCLALISCDDDSSSPSNDSQNNSNLFDILLSGSVSDTEGSIVLESWGNTNDLNNTYNAHASIFTNTIKDTKSSVGNLEIDNNSLSINSYDEYYSLDDFSGAFGKDVAYEFAGNSSNSITMLQDTLYIPVEIEMTLTNPSSHDKTTNLPISWNSDANNSYVYIRVAYSDFLNSKIDSTITSGGQLDTLFVVPDNGRYSLNSSIFSSMPVNGYLSVMIGRGNYKITTGARKYLLFGGSADDAFLKLTN